MRTALRGLLITAGLLALTAFSLRAQEVQRHGLVFEQWLRDIFFHGYKPESYTQKWDIPATENRQHGGVPVNPKATKYGTPVDLGDALRQIKITEPFLLIIGYWQQDSDTKRIVNIVAPAITPELWQKLWAPVTLADLEKLDDGDQGSLAHARASPRAGTGHQARAAIFAVSHRSESQDRLEGPAPAPVFAAFRRRVQVSRARRRLRRAGKSVALGRGVSRPH